MDGGAWYSGRAMWVGISIAGLVLAGVALGYLWLIALGAVRVPAAPAAAPGEPRVRFAIAVPAHDEAPVIEATVGALRALDYPEHRFRIWVVADRCSDDTAARARAAGATCLERSEGPGTGKAAALRWLLAEVLAGPEAPDAVVVFDADTRADAGFLRAMAARLEGGEQVVQGRHRIANPGDGWYPAMSDVQLSLNNRIFNQGRANLGLSAMSMGDSFCIGSALLREAGWGDGLTEDHDLRLRLLERGVRIGYEPAAVGWGEAPVTWAIAARQRARWLAGLNQSARAHLGRMVRLALRRPSAPLVDGIARIVLPSYSTLTVLAAAALAVQGAAALLRPGSIPAPLLWGWGGVLFLLAVYPFFGLALDGAPLRAYAVSLTGPLFVVWRTWLAVRTRLGGAPREWLRTPRRGGR